MFKNIHIYFKVLKNPDINIFIFRFKKRFKRL